MNIGYLLNKMNTYGLSYDEYRYLQRLLIENAERYKDNYPIVKTNISSEKILFISDTHIGGACENEPFIRSAYNYALKNNIKEVIHAGDLIEGTCRKYSKTHYEVNEEIERAISLMPNEIKTKLLLGNHDYYAIFNYPDLLDKFFNSNKLDILGMRRVLLNWNNDSLIGINHDIDRIKIKENLDELITLYGHSHVFSVEDGLIRIPSLSDYSRDKFKRMKDLGIIFNVFEPVFIIFERYNDNIIIKQFGNIGNDQSIRQSQEEYKINIKTKQLTRQINNKYN